MTDENTTPETVEAAPAYVRPIRAGVDTVLAVGIYTMATTNETGATNGVVYLSTDDDEYKAAVARWRKHLASRLGDTQRVRVVPFVKGDGVSFAVQVAAKRQRKAK